MARFSLLLVALAGCNEEVEYNPTLAFLAPAEAATVAVGDVPVSIVVEDFELEAPEAAHATPVPLPLWLRLLVPAAQAHNEGTPAGYCELSLDGAVVTQLAVTQFTLTGVTAGEHTLSGELFFADGDGLEEAFSAPVTASVTFTAE